MPKATTKIRLTLTQTDAVVAALLGHTQTIAEAATITGLDPVLIDMFTLEARVNARLKRCTHCRQWMTYAHWNSLVTGCPNCGESSHLRHCRQCDTLIPECHWFRGVCKTCGFVNHPSRLDYRPDPNWQEARS